MTEKDFTEKLHRQNIWIAVCAFVLVVVTIVGAWGALRIMEESIQPGEWLKVFMVVIFLLLLIAGSTWALRGSQRHDLYTVVTGMTITQLKRFRGEIEDVIEKLEEEFGQEQARENKIRRIK